MKRFFTFLETELKLSLRDMNMPIFAVIMPLAIFIILGMIYGKKPAFDGADHTFLEQNFAAVGAVEPVLPVCIMLCLTALCTGLAIRFFRWE